MSRPVEARRQCSGPECAGSFVTAEEAARAAVSLRLEHFTHSIEEAA